MDMGYYDDFSELFSCVKKAYRGNIQERVDAFQILQEMSNDPIRFLNSMLSLAKIGNHSNEQMEFDLKGYSLATLSEVLSSEMNEAMEKREMILDILLDHIFSVKLSFHMNSILQHVLQIFFFKEYSNEYTQKTISLVKEKLEYGNLDDICGALHILKSTINNCTLSEQTSAELFKCLEKGLRISGDRLLEETIAGLMRIPKNSDYFRNETIFDKAKTLKLFIEIIVEFSQILIQSKSKNHANMILSQKNILKIFKRCLMFVLPSDTQIKECLFSTSRINQLDEILNAIKDLVISFFNINIEPILSDPGSTLGIYNKYTFITTDVFDIIGESIINLFKSGLTDLENTIDCQDCLKECIITSLKFLAEFARKKEECPFFIKHRNALIIDVCLALIRTTKAEIRNFIDGGERIIDFGEQICMKQYCDFIKSQAAIFLRVMCEEIDGTLTYVIMILLNIIEFSIASDDLETIPNEFPTLIDCRNSIFLAKTHKEIRIETSVLILVSISDLIKTRPDLIKAIEKLFSKNLSFFLGDQITVLVQSRLCFFVGFLLPFLFNSEEYAECYQAYLEFLVRRAEKQEQTFSWIEKQANICLSLLFESKEGTYHKLSPHVQKILGQLSNKITSSKFHEFFQLLLQIFRNYKGEIEKNLELMLEIVRLLAKRALEEYKLHLGNSSRVLRLIGKNINYITASKELASEYQTQIEEYWHPMVVYLECIRDLPFKNDILIFATNNIKIRREVTDFIWNIAKRILKNLPRNPGKSYYLGQFLSQLIIYGKEKFEQDRGMTESLLYFGKKLISSSSRANILRATSVFSLVIEYININDKLWNKILIYCLDKLRVISDKSLSVRLMGVFLCAFYKNFQATQNLLIRHDAMKFIIEGLLQNYLELIENPHERKILLIGLSNLLSKDILHPSMSSYLPQILSLLTLLLKYVEIDEQMKLEEEKCKKIEPDNEDFSHASTMSFKLHFASICGKKEELYNKLKNLSNVNIQNSIFNMGYAREENKDQDIEDQESEDLESDESEDSVSNFISEEGANEISNESEREIIKIDEFTYFKNAVHKFKETFPEDWNLIYNVLSEDLKGLLKEVLDSQRVPMDQLENNSPVRRIVKPMHRKLQI